MIRWRHFYHVLCTKTDTLTVRTRTKVYQGDWTFLDETVTVTPVPTHRPTLTQALLQQQLYRTSETSLKLTIARLLQPHDISVAHKPIRRLHALANVKAIKTDWKTDREHCTKIKYCNCRTTYIGETGRNFSTRLAEHKRATRNGDIKNHNTEHHLQTKHQIHWVSATCIKYSTAHGHY